MGYNDKYYKRHLDRYRDWENKIGEYIYKVLNLKSILDFGCGVGSYLEGAKLAGCEEIFGIELNFDIAKTYFVDEVVPFIIKGDITEELGLSHKYDCVVSFEVAEHIDPDGTDKFINNLIQYSNNYIIITAAPPGQRGTGHINLREKDFWIKEIGSKGVVYNDKIVQNFRTEWKKMGAAKYILNNLMVFQK